MGSVGGGPTLVWRSCTLCSKSRQFRRLFLPPPPPTPLVDILARLRNAYCTDRVHNAVRRALACRYATAMVGKWHLGFRTWTHTPIERGFDTFFGYYAGSTDYFKIQSLCW